MKEAQFVSVLAHPRLDFCSEVVTNQDKQLTIAYSLKGQNATSFCKDLANTFSTWQITTPEQLHQKILDLLVFIRQEKLELEFALSLLDRERIIFATYSGQVILKRNQQVKKILASLNEIKIVTGLFKDNDQIILINKTGSILSDTILKMLEENVSLEKLISEISLLQEKYKNNGTSLAFLTHQEKIDEIIEKPKFDFVQLVTSTSQTIKKILTKILDFTKKIPSFLKKIYTWVKNQNKKKLLTIFISCTIITIFLLITFVLLNKQKQTIVSNIQEKIVIINKDTQNIDQLVLQQPLTAREKAQKSLQAMETLKKEKNNRESLKLIETEINKLQEIITKISGDNSLDQLSIAYNLDNFLGTKVEVKDNLIFILENSGQEILKITPDQNKEKIILENNEKIRDFTVSENKLFVLSNGIKMLDLESNEKKFINIKEEGESDKDAEHLSSFGPYLYLVNQNKRNIYRYYYNADKLSDPIGWLIDKQGLNFENISDLVVDGDLWLGDGSGKLSKFSKGYTADFQIAGLSILPNSTISLSTNENINTVAILEKQNKRLLILTKDGQLISEIKSNELAGVSSIAFNNDGKKIYALSGSVVYEVEL